jgi:hypothetical protein
MADDRGLESGSPAPGLGDRQATLARFAAAIDGLI